MPAASLAPDERGIEGYVAVLSVSRVRRLMKD
jgi:hypothetical protein